MLNKKESCLRQEVARRNVKRRKIEMIIAPRGKHPLSKIYTMENQQVRTWMCFSIQLILILSSLLKLKSKCETFFIIELVVQCRKRNKVGETLNDFGFFQKGWNDYRTGFGEIGSDYWIGLDLLHNMTAIENTIWRLEAR